MKEPDPEPVTKEGRLSLPSTAGVQWLVVDGLQGRLINITHKTGEGDGTSDLKLALAF